MRLLILTQKVDMNDPVLGFFHRWIAEFSKYCEKVIVVCLEEGNHELPDNVAVYSLGKENGKSRTKYILNFYKLLWSLRKEYDSVFVHMNQEYVLLGGVLWKLLGKKIYMWRNHLKGTFLTSISVMFCYRVYTTSPLSYVARFKKTKVGMPVGVEVSDEQPNRVKRTILFMGRISPVKNVDIFVEAIRLLSNKEVDFSAVIIGSPTANDNDYNSMIIERSDDLIKKGVLKILPGVAHSDALKSYGKYDIFVNLTPSGSLDKTILEALSAKAIVLVFNSYFENILPDYCVSTTLDPQTIADKMELILSLTDEEKETVRTIGSEYALSNHSINILISRIVDDIRKTSDHNIKHEQHI